MSESYFLTTPIYYVNAEPHIGHTYTTVVADTLVRYRRLCGERAVLLTGTDEHGEKILEAAEARGQTPAEFSERNSSQFRSTWDSLGIAYDRFVRTTDADHARAVQGVLQQVHGAGHIDFREYEGDYCVGCERFLTDRDLVDGLCRDHERTPERRSESNYFFRMSDHFDWLVEYIESNPDFIRPERYRNEVLAMLRDQSGLGDLCISRPRSRLDWGIPLPFDEDYVCYVWFDALLSYITGVGFPDDPGFPALWEGGEHLIGKDILKPHGVFWPTMLKAMGLPLPRHVSVHGYWNVDNRKVSKTLGNMVSPLIMRDRYGFEAFRYFLLRDMSFGLDSNFSEEALVARVNADLANNLGNLVSRTLNMTKRFADGRVPEPGEPEDAEREVASVAAEAAAAVDERVRKLEVHLALEAIFRLVDATNRYLELREPWKAAKDPERVGDVGRTLYTCCESLRILGVLLAAFLPETSSEIWRRLGLEAGPAGARLPADAVWGGLASGGETTAGAPLFPRIEDEAREVG